jgi:hypothetical protein
VFGSSVANSQLCLGKGRMVFTPTKNMRKSGNIHHMTQINRKSQEIKNFKFKISLRDYMLKYLIRDEVNVKRIEMI